MRKLTANGYISTLAIAFGAVCVAFVVALIFGLVSHSNADKYKNDDYTLIAQAVAAAKTKQAAQLNAQFQVESENPFTSYTGPSQYGSVYVPYPKNWSAYIDTAEGNPVDGYFEPGTVPSTEVQSNVFALRLQINPNSYSNELQQYTSQQKSLGLSITPYVLKKVPSITGVMITGEIQADKVGEMIILPLRTNTLEIWTESTQYESIFNSQILPQVTFQP